MRSQTVNRPRKRGNSKSLVSSFLVGDSIPLRYALISVARFGLCALDVYRLIHRERFELILGLSDRLERLKLEHNRLGRAQWDDPLFQQHA